VATAFEALGFGAEAAEHLRIRAELMLALTQLIDAQGWTQAEAARQLGVTQPRISDLVRGKIDRFSIDTLVDLLTAAGAGVTVTVRRRRSAA
jgi:predicted XRE-type DNA-binding protein